MALFLVTSFVAWNYREIRYYTLDPVKEMYTFRLVPMQYLPHDGVRSKRSAIDNDNYCVVDINDRVLIWCVVVDFIMCIFDYDHEWIQVDCGIILYSAGIELIPSFLHEPQRILR